MMDKAKKDRALCMANLLYHYLIDQLSKTNFRGDFYA